MRHLAGLDPIHLEEVDEQNAVFVGGLLVVRGHAPVGDEGRLLGGVLAIEAVEAELGVGVAYIESQQHSVLSLYLSVRVLRRGGRRFVL